MTKPDDVCAKDCPDRAAGCHATCDKYLEFYRLSAEERSLQQQDQLAEGVLCRRYITTSNRFHRNIRPIKIKDRFGT